MVKYRAVYYYIYCILLYRTPVYSYPIYTAKEQSTTSTHFVVWPIEDSVSFVTLLKWNIVYKSWRKAYLWRCFYVSSYIMLFLWATKFISVTGSLTFEVWLIPIFLGFSSEIGKGYLYSSNFKRTKGDGHVRCSLNGKNQLSRGGCLKSRKLSCWPTWG